MLKKGVIFLVIFLDFFEFLNLYKNPISEFHFHNTKSSLWRLMCFFLNLPINGERRVGFHSVVGIEF